MWFKLSCICDWCVIELVFDCVVYCLCICVVFFESQKDLWKMCLSVVGLYIMGDG